LHRLAFFCLFLTRAAKGCQTSGTGMDQECDDSSPWSSASRGLCSVTSGKAAQPRPTADSFARVPKVRYVAQPGEEPDAISRSSATQTLTFLAPTHERRILSFISTSDCHTSLRKFEHKARRRRMRKQPILCIGDARLGGSDAAAGVEHAALGADHAAPLAHAARK
jgi:hypothetical protein